jgi:exodeoxyribonuclease VII small subunit
MAAKRNQVPPKSFEDALAELERILGEIEGGEVPLEESLLKYERGQFLIQHCRTVLSAAEKQIELLGKAQRDAGGAIAGGGDAALAGEPLSAEENE